jgi:uncharacterized RDD family membrane protein YckC
VSTTGAQQLSLATPERALLSLPIAGIGSRTLAYLIDFGLLLLAWSMATIAFSVFAPLIDVWGQMSSIAKVAALLGLFFTQWGYWTVAEVFWRGQTPGKKLMGIRVVRHDGSPVGLFESAVRNLVRFIDFLPVFYPVGLVTMLVDRQNRRLGDLAAGTVLVRVEKVDLARYATSKATATAAPVSAQDAEVITDFLHRAAALEPEARARLGAMLATRFLPHLSEAERTAALADPPRLQALLKARL